MDKQLLLVGTWFSTVIVALIFAALMLYFTTSPQQVLATTNTYQFYQALPGRELQITDSVSAEDARAKLVADFFQGYNSTLSDYAAKFVQVADANQLDFRLMPAIAMQESDGGKKMPKNSFNPFGFGIYGSTLLTFSSFDEAISALGKSLREDYLNQGLKTPYEIMSKYTPQSLSKGSSWAKGVSSFMSELR